jgi:hypothetical protein
VLTRRDPQPLSAPLSARIADRATADQEYLTDMQQQRDYFVGRQFVHLTERMREFLGGNVGLISQDWRRLRLNIYVTVINAVIERLIVSGLTTDEQGTTTHLKDDTGAVIRDAQGQPAVGLAKPLADWAALTWRKNRMDARQRWLYEMTLRDSEAFVVVTWDDTAKIARFIPHPRAITDGRTGSAFGCTAFYRNDDPEQQLEFVTKRWQEVSYDTGSRVVRERLTIYYPDKIEKYAGQGQTWNAILEAGDPGWPIRWEDKAGAPLGIPVVHLRSMAGFEASEAIGPQNAINKTIIDLLAAGDLTAFRIMIALGWKPVDDDDNPLPIDPGTWVGTERQGASAVVVPGADLSTISEQVYNWIQWAAMVTDTPVARFITSKQLAAEGTQKSQDGPLLNKLRMRQSELGNGIEDLLAIARRMHNAFWATPLLDEDAEITTTWEPLEARDEDAELTRADIKVNKLQIPAAEVWGELGYSEAKIAQWKAEAEQRKQEAMQQMQAEQEEAPQNGKEPAFREG